MTAPPKITAEVREWVFCDGRKGVRGKIYNDTRDLNFLDGDRIYIIVQSISEYEEFFLVKTQFCCFQCHKKDMLNNEIGEQSDAQHPSKT